MTQEEFDAWLERLLALYPQVTEVSLVGSRAFGYARPNSDWDVILCLEDDCYQPDEKGHPVQVDKIEQRLAYDPALYSKALDIFYLRPDGSLGRWDLGPDEELKDDPEMDEYVKDVSSLDIRQETLTGSIGVSVSQDAVQERGGLMADIQDIYSRLLGQRYQDRLFSDLKIHHREGGRETLSSCPFCHDPEHFSYSSRSLSIDAGSVRPLETGSHLIDTRQAADFRRP